LGGTMPERSRISRFGRLKAACENELNLRIVSAEQSKVDAARQAVCRLYLSFPETWYDTHVPPTAQLLASIKRQEAMLELYGEFRAQ
jgi:hypothetical protein